MLEKILHRIQQDHLLCSKGLVLVACSGGPDSICLLHVLHALGYEVMALHCNFHLRAAEANRDQAFVEKTCQDWGIPCLTTHFDTPAYAKAHKVSIEMAARDLRYAWFEEVRAQKKAQAIAVAHHLNDNIETCCLNLIRGTGITGLAGMKTKNGYIVRPLLEITRAEIEAYLQERNISWVVDSSNLETEFTRNKIRHELIPLMESIHPSFQTIMASNLKNFRAAQTIYQHYLEEQKKQWYRQEGDTTAIDLTGLEQQVEPETLLYEWVKVYKIHPAEIGKMLVAQTGKHFLNASYDLSIERSKDRHRWLVIRKK